VSADTVVAFAPGRVNIIGDHTDHTGGWCLPIAIDRGVTVSGHCEPSGERVRLTSDLAPEPADLAIGDARDPSRVEPGWARYVAAVIAQVRPSVGFTGHVSSNLPVGVGLSSSAALEVAVALAIGADTDDPVALARSCQAAEHAARGVPTGILDQISSICGHEGSALLLDCHTVEVTPVPLPPGDEVEWVVVVPDANRDLGASGYADRVADLRRAEHEIGPLRLATLADVERIGDPVARARARHVVSENQRVHDFVAAVSAADVTAAGELMDASHASLSHDYESSTTEIDSVCADLRTIDGVLGARITGGGWGGSVIALTRPGALSGRRGTWVVTPSRGAGLLQPPPATPG
jgi:galactokinase